MLQREGIKVGKSKVFRIYQEENMQIRRRKPKRRVQAKARQENPKAKYKNDIWGIDFVSDNLDTGQSIRSLTIVDEFTNAEIRFLLPSRTRASFNPWFSQAPALPGPCLISTHSKDNQYE